MNGCFLSHSFDVFIWKSSHFSSVAVVPLSGDMRKEQRYCILSTSRSVMVSSRVEGMLIPFMAEEAVLIVPGGLEAERCQQSTPLCSYYNWSIIYLFIYLFMTQFSPSFFFNGSSLLDWYIICDSSFIYLESTLVIHCI